MSNSRRDLFISATAKIALFALSYLIGLLSYRNTIFPVNLLKEFYPRVKSMYSRVPANFNVNGAYSLGSIRNSFFRLKADGSLFIGGGRPVRAEGVYTVTNKIFVRRTAIVVMDPWIDMPSSFLNEHSRKVLYGKILPLVKEALVAGHPIFVLTNDCSSTKYSCKIPRELVELSASKSGKLLIFHHQDLTASSFSDYLRSAGIDTLIYTGFHSNMCILGVEAGMIAMKQKNFRLFFVPEASAALEAKGTWGRGDMHRYTTILISQWIGGIIDYDEFLAVLRIKALR